MTAADPCPRCGSTARLDSAMRVCPACAVESALLAAGGDSPPGAPAPGAGIPFDASAGWCFGDYEILGEIAHGGMGVVYRARQRRLGRLVALKMIRAGHLARPADIQRFRTEATAAARLRHPNIVAIHEVGEVDGQHFYSMDLIGGRNLAELAAGQPWAPRRAALLLTRITRAIEAAHGQGILHRDLKPSNILVEPGDVPWVADFGLARIAADAGGDPTVSGTVLGSPSYMPPEQALGRRQDVDARSDVYALGAILYELLTGGAPFRAASAVETLRLVTDQEPIAPRVLNPGIPADLETICLRCLAKVPAQRYPDAGHLADELDRYLADRPIRARPVSAVGRGLRWCRRQPALAAALAAAGLLLVAVAGVSTLAALRIQRARQATEQSLERAVAAEALARRQLRASLLAQARASRATGQAGQREEALRAATQAAALAPGRDARDEMIAALALPDLRPGTPRPLPGPADRLVFDPDRGRYLLEEPNAGLTLHGPDPMAAPTRLGTAGARVRGLPVFSPDGRFAASRLADDSLRCWALPSGAPAWTLPGRPYPDLPRTTRFGEDLAFDPRGRWFAAGHPGGGVTFHDPASGREVARWRDPRIPRRAAASPDGGLLALADFTDATRDGVVVVDAATGTESYAVPGTEGVRGIAWSPDATRLAVSRGGRVEILRLPGGGQHRRLETPDGPAFDLAFDPTGEWILTHSSRAVFRWWNVREGRVALAETRPVAIGARIGVASDFTRIMATAGDRQVETFGFEPARLHRVLHPPESAASHQVASAIGTLDFSPDGGWVAVACLDEVHVREVATGASVARLTRPVRSDWLTARFGSDRTLLYVSSRTQGLAQHRLSEGPGGRWEFDAGTILDPEDDYLVCSIHRPTGRLALAGARRRHAFKLLSPDGGTPAATWPAVQAYEATFSPDGRLVAANCVPTSSEPGPGPRQIEIRDAATGALVRTLDAPIGATARWSTDGGWLLTTSMPDRVDLWRTSDWTRGPALPAEARAPGGTFALSPDGRHLAAFNEKETFLVSTGDGALLGRLTEPPGVLGYVTDMAFSPDGRTLALLRRNGALTLWDMEGLGRALLARGASW